MSVHFDLLGPVQLTTDQRGPMELGPPQRRAVLALLLLADGKTVSVATLRERIWANTPPASAPAAIQVHVHHLRRILTPLTSDESGCPRLLTHPGTPSPQVSYELDIGPGSTDLTSFRRHLDEGEQAFNRGDLTSALRSFDAALSRWRGQPFPELQPSAYVLNIRRSLTSMRRDAAAQRASCLLELGSLTPATEALQELHAEQPDDERVVALLATALQRAGADGRALRLVTEALARWENVHGVLPPTLLRQRDLMVSQTGTGLRQTGDAV